jgi:hypothetical protein
MVLVRDGVREEVVEDRVGLVGIGEVRIRRSIIYELLNTDLNVR